MKEKNYMSKSIDVQVGNMTTRQKWTGLGIADRLARLDGLYIVHDAANKILRHIQDELVHSKARGKSSGTLILADSGAGKSRFIKYLTEIYPDQKDAFGTTRRVVHFKVPSSPTPKQMGAAFLRALGDPLADRGNAEAKKNRIAQLLIQCKTLVVAIDDFQDVPARKKAIGVQAIADWMRDLMEMQFPGVVLAFGTNEAAIVRISNVQLKRRMPAVMELPIFEISTTDGQKKFRSLLQQIDEHLPLAQISNLASPALMARIYIATNGNFDYLMKLLSHSLKRAVESGSESLSMEQLEKGFDDLHQIPARNGNPFSGSFNGSVLDQRGQVFHQQSDVDLLEAEKSKLGVCA